MDESTSNALGRTSSQDVPTNLDPEAQLRMQEQESERHLASPAASTGLSLKWLQLGRLKVPVGLKLGLKLGGRFRHGPKSKLELPPPSGKQWNSEKGRFE